MEKRIGDELEKLRIRWLQVIHSTLSYSKEPRILKDKDDNIEDD